MALLPRSLRRPTAILKMPAAMARGLTPSGFLKELQKAGVGYRKTTFLQDWRSVFNIEARKGVRKYTRKDRLPKMSAVADVEWSKMQKEYMHKVQVFSRVAPGEPLVDRIINIMSDKLLTQQELIDETNLRWETYENYQGEKLERVMPIAIMHRIPKQGSLAE